MAPRATMPSSRLRVLLLSLIHICIRPESLSTCGYDDDGVKTRQFPIIKAGIFVGYQTIRDQAHLIGQTESMGCCYADSYASVPFQRMPNVWLEPGDKPRCV